MSDRDEYATLLDIVADNPATTAERLTELASEHNITETDSRELLSRAINSGDVKRADGKHWIVRKARFAYHEYDHPETSE